MTTYLSEGGGTSVNGFRCIRPTRQSSVLPRPSIRKLMDSEQIGKPSVQEEADSHLCAPELPLSSLDNSVEQVYVCCVYEQYMLLLIVYLNERVLK